MTPVERGLNCANGISQTRRILDQFTEKATKVMDMVKEMIKR